MDRTKEEVVALIKSLSFAPLVQAGAVDLKISATDGSNTVTIRRAAATRTKTSNSGIR